MEKTVFTYRDQYDRELEHGLKVFVDGHLRDKCYVNVLELTVTYGYSDEPTPFNEISTLNFQPIKVGEGWSKKNFACAWFHLTGKLPENIDRNNLYLDFACIGEGLLVDKNGHAIKGFTEGTVFNVSSDVAVKRYYPIDENIVDEDGNIDAYVDGAANNLLGEFPGEAKLKFASIVRKDAQMQELYYDFDVLVDLSLGTPFSDDKKIKIIRGLRKARNYILYEDPDFYAKSKAIINELYALAGCENLKVTAIGHAHVDLAWLWPIRETKRKAKRTFANAVYLMKRYPNFHFAVPQPQQLAWMKELDPVLYEEIKQFAKEGRMEPVGGGWVENDTNVPCEEALVRQELYGQKFWKEEFGKYVNLRWLPDTFGYSGAMPQILKLSAQDYFMTIKISWSNRTIFPYNTFYWAGIDGTDVLVHMPPEGTYNSQACPRSLIHTKNQMALRPLDKTEDFLMVYGIGDGGGGPSERMLERLKRMENLAYLPKVKLGTAQSFFDGLKGGDYPRYEGEMYLEKHRATYTSQSNNKNHNRDCESKLIAYEALLACLGQKGDKAVIDELWKEVLLYQFHDILPGSSIKRVYDETEVAYARIKDELETLVADMGASFVAKKDKNLINMSGKSAAKIEKIDGGYAYYKGNELTIAPVVYDTAKQTQTVDEVETDYYVARFDADGSFKEIILKANGKVMAKNANKLRVFIDRGDSWDFEDDYREQPEVFMTLVDSRVSDYGELIEVQQNYAFKNSKLTQTILMHKNEPTIRIYHDASLVDVGYMIRAEIEPNVWSDVVNSDIQFGYLARPTTDETDHDAAQFETCCQKWFDLSDEAQGFAVLNNTKNGFMAKQGMLSINLVRSTEYPAIEQDKVSYSYALYPHVGGFNPIDVDEKAREFNDRALYGDLVAEMPKTDNEQVEITAFKPAYDGDAFILRMFERTGAAATANLVLPTGFALASEVDLLEDEMAEAPNGEIAFKPFQIRTFKVIKK